VAQVWLITGSTRGLDRAIAEGVLAAGDKLIATARHPPQLSDLVERYGDHVRSVALDVTNERAALAAVQLAVDVVTIANISSMDGTGKRDSDSLISADRRIKTQLSGEFS